jgi:UDP-2-acetamido-2,6-beta-L-arabino-hexul-4-ose reductase
LEGRYKESEYGRSKLAGEKLFLEYAKETGVRVLIYRFPNLFGKWCRPDYNSAVATFCHAIANGLDYRVDNRDTKLELVYIDDLVEEMLDALEGKEHRCEYEDTRPVEKDRGRFCFVPVSHKVSLGEIVDLLNMYNETWKGSVIPEIPSGSFEKKLYSAYLSYLPREAMSRPLDMRVDNRGMFTELIKTERCGQVSVNVARPGNVRGQHWHNSKWEIFMVVSGHGLIRQRKIGKDEKGDPYPVIEFEVTGEQMQAVRILPGYAHSIENLSETENLVTVMWANERFEEARPDTFFEEVEGN